MDTHAETGQTKTPKPEQFEIGISVRNLTLVLLVFIPLLFAIVVLTNAGYQYVWNQAYFENYIQGDHFAVDPASAVGKTESDLRNEQFANIGLGAAADGAYGWKDENAGTVTIPIERAMTLTVRDLNNE
ncbi:hypothetical protein [Mucisphaera sp.]|uniref:hypothetical protein n=1 Tax=Mucisphaera sp. TaxID=2913024 RepID=UPI003D14F767